MLHYGSAPYVRRRTAKPMFGIASRGWWLNLAWSKPWEAEGAAGTGARMQGEVVWSFQLGAVEQSKTLSFWGLQSE